MVSASVIHAQADTTIIKKDSVDFYEMSLEQLLKLKAHGVPTELEKLINSLISVASKKPLNTRESPSIISLITEDEIAGSGARDLMDVLRLVPGFDFGVDVEGVVGVGIRGNWAHEGKVLMLIDGQEMNEILFATNQFGNRYPVEQIKRIEIIRGPGSAIYGGFAEYGVINIITKQGADINGVNVSGTYGQGSEDYLRRNVSLSLGQKIKDVEYSICGSLGQGQRSNGIYTNFQDSSYSMTGNSQNNPAFFNAGIKYKSLSFRAIGDFFQTTMRDGYGNVIPGGAVQDNFGGIFSELKYIIKVNDKLTITPRINYKSQTPWQSEAYTGKEEYNRTATRTLGNITASYNLNRYINFVLGSEYFRDDAIDKVDSSYFSNNKQKVSYYNYAFFAQGLIKTRIVNFILGARYDKHNEYGDAFVPRVGLTKKYGKFHFKALYSSAFRAPSIENINFSTVDGIKPELTQVAEVELGYQLTRKSFFNINVYDITTNNPIVYYTDSTSTDYYINSGHSGTQGIEAEYRLKQKWGQISVNYAYYSAGNKEKIPDYEVSDNASALMAFANHRVNLNSSFNLAKGLSLSPTVSFYGARYGYSSVDSTGTSVAELFSPTTLVNIYLRYSTTLKGLTIGLGVYDILDEQFKFLQPYNGYHAPLPGPGREIVFRLQYTLNYKSKTD